MQKPSISIIGLGKLGSPMAACYASKGCKVIGVDINSDFVRLINEGKPPVTETNLAKYLVANQERISATQDYEKAVLNSDITFIVVSTPSEPNGCFSNKNVIEAGKKIGKALAKKSDFHLVVLTSTVIPSSTENKLLPILEEYSGKKCKIDFGLSYNPEFIALGSVIHDILNPDFILIGESDFRSGDILESFYQNLCDGNPPIKRMNIVNAEITKIALNTYITTKISYANMLAELCEKIPGGNAGIVTNALGCDTRIGPKYLKGALSYGGPCFPRDNRALIHTAKKFGTVFPIAEATEQINKNQIPRLEKLISSVLSQNNRVGILGLSYKPETDVIEESSGIKLACILSEKGIPVIVYDPFAIENAKQVLKEKVDFASSLRDCVQRADVIVITTPWKEFNSIEPDWLKTRSQKSILIDCWGMLNPEKYKQVVKYLAIGTSYKD